MLRDALTGLAGPGWLDRALDGLLGPAERRAGAAPGGGRGGEVLGAPGALLVVDLDRIRHVNDALGHRTGDELLRGVARILEGSLPPGARAFRLHADVFAVLAPGLKGPRAASDLARRILAALETPIRCGGYSLYTTAGIGIALYPEHGRDAVTVLRHAHTALGVAKGRGGQAVELFTERSGDEVWRQFTIDQGLRAAIDRDELVLHYQPVVDLRSGRVTSAEALLRWDRPLHGLTPAAAFVPVAEQTGLIVAIGGWVLRRAALQAERWHRLGLLGRVAVNVGAREFHDGHLYEALARTLDETGAPPSALTVEITETVALADVDHAAGVLECVRGLGVRTALDDFGTGYSSLRYLQELPLDSLKVDRSLVANGGEPGRGQAVLSGVVELGRRLGLQVVAEGVEDEATLRRVTDLGCHAAQGYHLGRPAPPSELEGALDRRAPRRPGAPVAPAQPASTTCETKRSSCRRLRHS